LTQSDAISNQVGADSIVGARGSAVVSDGELAALLRARSADAWELLFERHYDRITAYAYARLNDQSGAEDVASATFQRALNGIGSYRHTGKPVLAWLYGIARNVVKEEQRAQRRRHDGLRARLTHDNQLVSRSHSAARAPEDIDRSIDLDQALKTLTGLQHEVVLLRYFAGLSAAEVSRVLNRPESAVYALQARAVEALRRKMP
jgi:RNA polymerase sigma-70 factor (ECF subfamily)